MIKQKKKKKKIKKGKGKAAIIVLVLIFILGGVTFIGYKVLRVAKIEVTGVETISCDYVAELSKINIGEHVFNINESEVSKNIEADPYLDLISLKIKYPDQVILTVKERKKAAAIKALDTYVYIDTQGYVLEMGKVENISGCIVINGIDIAKYTLGEKMNFSDELRFSAVTEILSGIYASSLNDVICDMDFSNINGIVLNQAGGIKIKFGQADNIEKKMEWIKSVLANLSEQGKTSGVLDVSTAKTAYFSPEIG